MSRGAPPVFVKVRLCPSDVEAAFVSGKVRLEGVALMTGHAYATSARTAARMGPFAGYVENKEPTLRVLQQHRAAAAHIDEELAPTELLSAAQQSWDTAVELAEQYGVRNSQASVLAPTGCLVGGSLIPTERGLVRLRSLGDVDGDTWQLLEIDVQTDEGPQAAAQFFERAIAIHEGLCKKEPGNREYKMELAQFYDDMAILLVDKNLKVLARLADRHYVLERGRVCWSGDSRALGKDYEAIRRVVGL